MAKSKGGKSTRGDTRQRGLLLSFGVALGVVAVAGLLWYGWVLTWRGLSGMEEFRVYPGRLALAPVPWLDSEAFVADVRRTDDSRLLKGSCSYFTPKLAQRVAAAYMKSPWVAKVTHVRRKFPNRLEIGLVLRRPFAHVRWQTGEALVDKTGLVLSPLIYRMPEGGLGRPDIVLEERPRIPPRAGAVWRSKDVLAGIEMLKYTVEQPVFERYDIEAIEVGHESGIFGNRRLCLMLRTRRGPNIRWGLPPNHSLDGTSEVGTRAKVGALQTLLLRYADELTGREYIDIRYERWGVPEGTRSS